MLISLCTCVIIVILKGVVNAAYTNNAQSATNQCNGRMQSPIDIRTDYVYSHESCFCPSFDYESNYIAGQLRNKGHEVVLTLADPYAVQLTDVPYREGTYVLHSFHIHFGGFDYNLLYPGSDHTLNGQMFDGEIHLVFFNSKYINLDTAMRRRDGLVVLGYWVQRLPLDIYDPNHLSSFLRSHIPVIANDAGFTTDATIDMLVFLNNSCDLFTYPGSLTTGECYETVRWIMFRHPLQINYHDWNVLSLVRISVAHNHNPRIGNHRPTQPINERVVVSNFGPETYC